MACENNHVTRRIQLQYTVSRQGNLDVSHTSDHRFRCSEGDRVLRLRSAVRRDLNQDAQPAMGHTLG